MRVGETILATIRTLKERDEVLDVDVPRRTS